MSFKQHQPIETDLQEHHAWERIGITTHQEKNAVMTIIYEIFAAIVSHIQVLGMPGNQSIDGAVWYMFNSKTQRDSLRNAFVASPFLARLPANVKATRKTTLKHEMYRLLEWNKELFKNTYLQYGRVQPQNTPNGGFGYRRATVIPNADVQLIRADQTKAPLAFRLSDFLPNQVNAMDRSPEGDWINGASISSAQFTNLRQNLINEGVLRPEETLWWCPASLIDLGPEHLRSPQPSESRLISFNIASVIDRTISQYFPHLRPTSPDLVQGLARLTRPSFTIIIRPELSYGGELRPAREQPNLSHPGASVYGSDRHPDDLFRCGSSDYSLTLVGDGPTNTMGERGAKRRLDEAEQGWISEQGGPGPQQVDRVNKLDKGPTSVARNYNPFSPDGHKSKRMRLAMESPAYSTQSESESDISLRDVNMDES